MKEMKVLVAAMDSYHDANSPKIVPLNIVVPTCNYTQEIISDVVSTLLREKDVYCSNALVYHDLAETSFEKKVFDLVDWDNVETLSFEPVLKELEGATYRIKNLWETLFCREKVLELEPFFAADENMAEYYAKRVRTEWIDWKDEELIQSPVWLFFYAQKVCKGRLPDHLDNAMNMMSFRLPDSRYVKRYFRTKRYRIKCGKSLLNKKEELTVSE